MTEREQELFRVAVNLAVSLDQANPEVGMGPSRYMIAQDVAAQLSFEVADEEIRNV